MAIGSKRKIYSIESTDIVIGKEIRAILLITRIVSVSIDTFDSFMLDVVISDKIKQKLGTRIKFNI